MTERLPHTQTGIDAWVLEALGNNTFQTRSGIEMAYRNDPDRICVYALDDSIHQLEVTVQDGYLSFDVFTKGYNGNPEARHPDLYAKDFIKQALAIFRQRGFEVRGLQSDWLNFSQYASEDIVRYEAHLKTGWSQPDAALQTWCGQLAQQLGFTRVTELTESRTNTGHLRKLTVTFE